MEKTELFEKSPIHKAVADYLAVFVSYAVCIAYVKKMK